MKTISLITLLLFSLGAPLAAQDNTDEPIEGELIEGELTGAQDQAAGNDEESLDDGSPEEGSLDADIEALKKEVLSLNRDLFILEEDLLFPSNTQFSVFLSMDSGALFNLDSVQLKIDDKNIANHLYTERELEALKRGGVQRLYIGNLNSKRGTTIIIATHDLTSVFCRMSRVICVKKQVYVSQITEDFDPNLLLGKAYGEHFHFVFHNHECKGEF